VRFFPGFPEDFYPYVLLSVSRLRFDLWRIRSGQPTTFTVSSARRSMVI
jgi:hypothetical protein